MNLNIPILREIYKVTSFSSAHSIELRNSSRRIGGLLIRMDLNSIKKSKVIEFKLRTILTSLV